MGAIRYQLEGVEGVLREIAALGKKADAAMRATVKSTTAKALKLAKPLTPKATGRKGRGKKAGGIKRLSQSLKMSKPYGRGGKYKIAVSWGGQPGLARYNNFLNYGALRYTRRKLLIRKDGRPSRGKLARVGAVNQHNSRRGRHKRWANNAWARIKGPTEQIFIDEARKRIDKAIKK